MGQAFQRARAAAHLAPRGTGPRRTWQRLILLVAALACAGNGAQAAPLQDKNDALPLSAASAPAGGGTTLNRALQVDTAAARRGADMLQLGRTPAEPSNQPSARRAPVAPLPSQTPVPVTAQMSPAPTEEVGRIGLHGEPSGSGDAQRWAGGDTGGRGGQADASGVQLGGLPDAAAAQSGRLESRDIHPLLRGPLLEVVQFLRENRLWVFGSVVLLVAALAAMQATGRRGGASPETRAREAAAAQARADAAADRQQARRARRSRRQSPDGH